MSERTQSRPESAPASDDASLVNDAGWAPLGWTPSDAGWVDDAPFGSVLGDPLMGSPLFDEAVVEEERARRIASYGVSPDGAGFAAGAAPGGARADAVRTASDDATARLRTDMEHQQAELRQRTAQQQAHSVPNRAPARSVPQAAATHGAPHGAYPGAAQGRRPVQNSYAAPRQPAQVRAGATGQPRAVGRIPSAPAARMRPGSQGASRGPQGRAGTRSGRAGSSKAGSAIGWIVILLVIIVNVLGH